MKKENISVRVAAISIVYGWLGLLVFALAATALHARTSPDAPGAHKAAIAAAQGHRH